MVAVVVVVDIRFLPQCIEGFTLLGHHVTDIKMVGGNRHFWTAYQPPTSRDKKFFDSLTFDDGQIQCPKTSETSLDCVTSLKKKYLDLLAV
jgi:hypothetical protein